MTSVTINIGAPDPRASGGAGAIPVSEGLPTPLPLNALGGSIVDPAEEPDAAPPAPMPIEQLRRLALGTDAAPPEPPRPVDQLTPSRTDPGSSPRPLEQLPSAPKPQAKPRPTRATKKSPSTRSPR